MKKPQSKVQTQGKSNIKFTSRAENARESNQYLLPHHTGPITNLWTRFGCKTRSFFFNYAKTVSFSFFQVQALLSNDAWEEMMVAEVGNKLSQRQKSWEKKTQERRRRRKRQNLLIKKRLGVQAQSICVPFSFHVYMRFERETDKKDGNLIWSL